MASGGEPGISDHDEEMGRQLSCSICLELFVDPVLLPCLHSLCRMCLDTFCAKNGERLQTILCPECNTQIDLGEIGPKHLKRNYPLNSLVAIYRESTKTRNRSRAPKKEKITHGQPPQNRIDGITRNNVLDQTMPGLQGHLQSQSIGPKIPISDLQGTQCGPSPAASQPEASVAHTDPSNAIADGQQLPATCCTCKLEKPKKADMICRTCNLSFCMTCLSLYHPDNMGHTLTKINSSEPSWNVAQPSQCPMCDPSSMTTIRCMDCGLAFCDWCLVAYHPTTVTTNDHTLVQLRAAPARPQPGAAMPTIAADQPAVPVADVTANRTSLGLADHSRNSVGDQCIVQELAHFADDYKCTSCNNVLPSTASYKCLDCSTFYCEGCVTVHQSEHPGHSVMDVSLTIPDVPAAVPVAPSIKSDRRPKKAVNVQLKLIELMNIRGDLMAELLTVLAARRKLLEEQSLPQRQSMRQ